MKNLAELADSPEVTALKKKVADLTHSFNEHLSKFGDDVKKYSAKGTDATAHAVSDNPFKAVGIAVACGLIVGFLMGRSK